MKLSMPVDNESFKYYLHKLTHIRVNTSKKNGISPHKPILLLSVISGIEIGNIKSNKIFITPELISLFKKIWQELVENPKHHCLFTLPFYHLTSSPFWNLVPKPGFQKVIRSKISMKSFKNLNEAVEYAEIDFELFVLLQDKEKREIIKHEILKKYFPDTKSNYSGGDTSYIDNLSNQILNEPSELYKTKIQKLQNELNTDSFEEEQFVRGSIFKRQIPLIYKNTCAVSGLQINATVNVSLVDACHIVPFSNSYDDTVTNGILLTPTIHRAFDRGLISINDNYKVMLSSKFKEEGQSKYSIYQFSDNEIFLPANKKFYPNIENLRWHRENVFKK